MSQTIQNKSLNNKVTRDNTLISRCPKLEIRHNNPEFHLPSSLIFSHFLTETTFPLNIDRKTCNMEQEPSSDPQIPNRWSPLVSIGIACPQSPSLRPNFTEDGTDTQEFMLHFRRLSSTDHLISTQMSQTSCRRPCGKPVFAYPPT